MVAKQQQILLLACYELGHQPLSLAWPTAVLREAGFTVTAVDLSVSPFPQQAAETADLIAMAVPMHTALRLGVAAARQARQANSDAHLCFYGLYAWLNADYLLAEAADSVIAGEYEAPLLELAQRLASGEPVEGITAVSTTSRRATPNLARLDFPQPDRQTLPGLDQYARYMSNGEAHLAGYVESSRGCLHTCRHCPVVPVYNGRFFIIPQETVLADIRQQVAAGARHISFGDPDFLNGPGHALNVCRALHREFPHLTFDFTTKVEHILEKQALFPELAALGCSFVISAFESVSNEVLAHLDKGHGVADMEKALAIVAQAGIAIQPTWVAFTPWTSLDDYLDLLTWIRRHDLIQHVPAVQLAVRLLIPPHSALLENGHFDRLSAGRAPDWLGVLDAANFTYTWSHPDPRMDRLHQEVTQLAQSGNGDAYTTFAAIERAAYALAQRPQPQWEKPLFPDLPPPRLSEDWFC
jgi:hypothetical protein